MTISDWHVTDVGSNEHHSEHALDQQGGSAYIFLPVERLGEVEGLARSLVMGGAARQVLQPMVGEGGRGSLPAQFNKWQGIWVFTGADHQGAWAACGCPVYVLVLLFRLILVWGAGASKDI